MRHRRWREATLALAMAAILLCSQFAPGASAQTQTTTVTISGLVTSFQVPTQSATGSITIAGMPFNIAAGTTITGANLIVVGTQLTMRATLDSSNNIIAPVEVRNDTARVMTVCGPVTLYTAATATASGSITIGGQTFAIEAGASVSATNPITVGSSICLNLTLDAFGGVVVAQTTSTAFECGNVTAFTAPTASTAGMITIDGETFNIAMGTTITAVELITVGSSVCLNATFDSTGAIIAPTTATTNHPPTLTIPGPQTIAAGSADAFTVTATGVNTGETVQLAASGLPENAQFNSATGQFTFTPTAAQAGQTFMVTFTATSSLGPATSGVVPITVSSSGSTGGGTGPIVFSVPSLQTVQVGQTLVFMVTADQGGAPLQLTAGNLPANASFNPSTGTLTFTPTADQAGQLLAFMFTANTSGSTPATTTVLVQVVGASGVPSPTPPVISAPSAPVIATSGAALNFTVTGASSTANCNVTVTTSTLPPNATFDASTGVFSFTPATTQENQNFFVTFTATDCSGRTSTTTVPIIVLPASTSGLHGSICVPVQKIVFDPTTIGTTCGPVTITILNLGGGTLNISSATLATGTSFHLLSSSGAMALAAGGTAQITVQFEPTAKGPASDRLIIASDDPNQPSFTIVLKGTGLKVPKQPQQ